MTLIMMIMNLTMMLISALLAMAFYTLSERKLLGYMQYRKGPNKPTIIALTVPLGDANKLFLKEEKMTIHTNTKFQITAPMMMIILSMFLWPIYPHLNQSFFMKLSIIYFLCITSMMIYATFIAGWGSNSKWGMLGALRGIAQTISYEVSMSMIVIYFITFSMSANTLHIMRNQYFWILLIACPMIMAWLISILAETHRAPLDFTEGESELVSGFNIEYSSSMFALIFMAEYMNILFMSLLTMSMLSSNTSITELVMKTTIMSLMFIWSRGSLPRLRYDILMNCLWKKILPASLMMLLLTMSTTMKMMWYCAGRTDNSDDVKYELIQYLLWALWNHFENYTH